jgi:hypothetical protein
LGLFEQFVLFGPDMASEKRCELEDQILLGGVAETLDQRCDFAMFIEESAHKRECVKGREEEFFFELEVIFDLDFELVDDALGERSEFGSAADGTLGEEGEGQAVLMLMRERNEAGVAQHSAADGSESGVGIQTGEVVAREV